MSKLCILKEHEARRSWRGSNGVSEGTLYRWQSNEEAAAFIPRNSL